MDRADGAARYPVATPCASAGLATGRRPARGARDRLQGGGDDVAVHADPVERRRRSIGGAVGAADLDIGGGLRVGAGGDRVLVIIEDSERDAAIALQGIDKGGDRPVADAFDAPLRTPFLDRRDDAPLAGAGLGQHAIVDEANPAPAEISLVEERPDVGAGQLLAGAVGDLLDDTAELDLQPARQVETMVG